MTKKSTVKLQAYFEGAEDDGIDRGETDYVAGLRSADGAQWGVRIPLDAATVEGVVLARANLSIALEVDGRLYIEPTGLDEDAIAAAIQAGQLPSIDLRSLIETSLGPDDLGRADAPLDALASLRGQLVDGLAAVDRAISGVKKR